MATLGSFGASPTQDDEGGRHSELLFFRHSEGAFGDRRIHNSRILFWDIRPKKRMLWTLRYAQSDEKKVLITT